MEYWCERCESVLTLTKDRELHGVANYMCPVCGKAMKETESSIENWKAKLTRVIERKTELGISPGGFSGSASSNDSKK